MSRIYSTISGDTFEKIAFMQMGDCKYMDKLIDANRAEIDNFIFGAGVKLKIPNIEKKTKIELPAWRN